ncbi:hypothetical protein [Haloarchaeobius sp. DFWS5]|uniref:hypothetical protein n=1 Tax=Haloarchaeobius sp. DFWS5 TaxID=3446114 RepID=UPI003EBEE796
MRSLPVEPAAAATVVKRAMAAYEPVDVITESETQVAGRTRRLQRNHEVVVDIGDAEWGQPDETVIAVFVRASTGYADAVPVERYRSEFLDTLSQVVVSEQSGAVATPSEVTRQHNES